MGEDDNNMKLSLDNIAQLTIDDLLNKEFECQCGKLHSVSIDRVIIEKNAVNKLPDVLKSFNYNRIFMVADSNTYRVAGKNVENILLSLDFALSSIIYQRGSVLVPDERAIGEFMLNYNRNTDVIVAVGSGVINDISKYMSFILGVPYIIIATAPSMDGYTSDCSAFIINNTKISIPSSPPKVIIGDIEILKNAPMEMILSGLGDMVGKYSALRDWKIGHIVTGEYYCEVIRKIVETSVTKCVQGVQGFKSRDEEDIKNLMEGLILSGIAMSFVGNSRPASGSEHHISHLWEMMFLSEGKASVFHGTKVGIATILVGRIAEQLSQRNLEFNCLRERIKYFDEQKWNNDIIRLYKKAAPEVLKLNKKPYDIAIEERIRRFDIIKEKWEDIVETITEVPSADDIENFLEEAGALTRPQDIGIDDNILKDTITYAKEIRQRYTILRLLWDMGLLDEINLRCL